MSNNYPYKPPLQARFIQVQIEDISTAGQKYVVPGFNGKVKRIHSVINGAIATADAVLTPKIGGTAITGGAITVANTSSAAGDVDSSVPTGANGFTDTDAIEIETNGASTNVVEVVVTLEVEPV